MGLITHHLIHANDDHHKLSEALYDNDDNGDDDVDDVDGVGDVDDVGSGVTTTLNNTTVFYS